jgi:tetratricopeptide (TPR) repeat protein
LTDFCLHTPLIALWGVGFLNFRGTDSGETKEGVPEYHGISMGRGFLMLGIALGLFAPPCFIPKLTEQFQADLQSNQLPHALRMTETAEELDPWDNRLTLQTADFLEKLYLATGDETWKKRSDQQQEKAIEMESTDGSLRFEKAKRLTLRINRWPTFENLKEAQSSWDEADHAVPYDAFMKYEKALFYYDRAPGLGGKWSLESLDNGTKAFIYFRQAEKLEPNFAQAWYFTGLCKRGMGDERGARDDFHRAFRVYAQFRDTQRIDDLEKLLVSLTPDQLSRLGSELGRR